MTTLAHTFFISPSLFLQGNNVNHKIANWVEIRQDLASDCGVGCLSAIEKKNIDYCSIIPKMEHSLSF